MLEDVADEGSKPEPETDQNKVAETVLAFNNALHAKAGEAPARLNKLRHTTYRPPSSYMNESARHWMKRTLEAGAMTTR